MNDQTFSQNPRKRGKSHPPTPTLCVCTPCLPTLIAGVYGLHAGRRVCRLLSRQVLPENADMRSLLKQPLPSASCCSASQISVHQAFVSHVILSVRTLIYNYTYNVKDVSIDELLLFYDVSTRPLVAKWFCSVV